MLFKNVVLRPQSRTISTVTNLDLFSVSFMKELVPAHTVVFNIDSKEFTSVLMSGLVYYYYNKTIKIYRE